MNTVKLFSTLASLFVATGMTFAQDSDANANNAGMRKLSDYDAMFADSAKIGASGGEAIYNAICVGCHMPEGKGAVGAGAYPALAENTNLEFPEYAIYIIVNGQKAMPPLGGVLEDQQIADVVSYIQTHFGNDYSGEVSAEQVAASRP